MRAAGPSMLSKFILVLLWSAFFCVLDLIIKYVVSMHLIDPPRVIPVTPFFNVMLTYNPGVSFGMFSQQIGALPYLFGVLQTMLVVGILVWACRAKTRIESFGLAAIAGGAVGNIIDRFVNRAVTDYLDFHAFGWSWPAFNMADVAIVCWSLSSTGGLKENRGHRTMPPLKRVADPLFTTAFCRYAEGINFHAVTRSMDLTLYQLEARSLQRILWNRGIWTFRKQTRHGCRFSAHGS